MCAVQVFFCGVFDVKGFAAFRAHEFSVGGLGDIGAMTLGMFRFTYTGHKLSLKLLVMREIVYAYVVVGEMPQCR